MVDRDSRRVRVLLFAGLVMLSSSSSAEQAAAPAPIPFSAKKRPPVVPPPRSTTGQSEGTEAGVRTREPEMPRSSGKNVDVKNKISKAEASRLFGSTSKPMMVTYDPAAIGIGESCPGNNDNSIGECAMIAKDYLVARNHFLDAWNMQRSPFAAMRLGDLAWFGGDPEAALQWYEQVQGSVMMQRMANLRRCEVESGCGVTGRNVPSAETFSGPFGDEALIRTARLYARSGFPELAAAILVDANGRGCSLSHDTCEVIASAALVKSTTTSTLALSLATRESGDGQDRLRATAARQLGLETLATDLETIIAGGTPPPRFTQRQLLAEAARKEREAKKKAALADDDKPKDEHAKDEHAKDEHAKDEHAKDEHAKDEHDDDEEHKDDKGKKPPSVHKRTQRDDIDDGVKHAEESLDKARRLLDVAGRALPGGGPK